MVRQGQLANLAAEIKSALEDGIETSGAICTDGTPAYGGTGTGEDFAEFTIYALDIGDGEADDFVESLPNIAFKGDRGAIEYMHDDNAIYNSNFIFEIRMPFHHNKTIDSTNHEYSTLCQWYLERLQYILDHMVLSSIMEAGRMNAGGMRPGMVDEEHDLVYTAQTMLSIQYAEEAV